MTRASSRRRSTWRSGPRFCAATPRSREAPFRDEVPVAVLPDVGRHTELAPVSPADVEAPSLAAAAGARLAQTRRCDDDRPGLTFGPDLELVALADRALVRVAGEDQLGSRVDEPGEDVVSARDRPLARPPRCADQVVVEDGDAQRSLRCVREQLTCPLELALSQSARLVSPRAHRIQPDDDELLGPVGGLARLPLPLELGERPREARRERVGDVVVA